MRPWLQRQPLLAGLAPNAHLGACAVILRRDAGLAIGIGAAVRRVGNELADARVARATPDHLAGRGSGWQVEPLLQVPQQRLAYASKLADFVDGQLDCRLDPPVGILLQPIAHLDEADRSSNDELAAPSLLVACRQRTLAQQIELVLVQAALQSQQEPVVTLPWGVDSLLVNQQRVHDTAHLDELLPIAAVACKSGDFTRCHRADLAKANLGNHALEPGTRNAAGGRAAEIVIDHLDL
jgi:hypothetical protein